MMEENLVVLTKNFPFNNGEDFLTEEINVLADKFKHITVLATSVQKKRTVTKEIASDIDVKVINESKNRTVKYIRNLLFGLFRMNDICIGELKKTHSLKGKIAVLYVYGKAKRIEKAINKLGLLNGSGRNYVYSYWFTDTALAAVFFKDGDSKIKAVSRAHGYDLYDYRSPIGFIPFREYVLSKIDTVYTISLDGNKYLTDRYPQYKDKIINSYLGTADYGNISSDNSDSGIIRIATCSNIIPLKRVHLVAEALAMLESENISFQWHCIGDGEQLPELKKICLKNIRKNEVHFYGRLNNKEVFDILRKNADMFVNVSESEGLPVSIMEAISFGIPVVATDVGGTKEIVTDTTGILIEKDTTAEGVKNAILQCADKNFDSAKIREFWNDNFNSQKNYSRFASQIKGDKSNAL